MAPLIARQPPVVCLLATAVEPLDAGALGSKLRPFSSVIFLALFFRQSGCHQQDPRLRCPARGVSSVFVSGDAYDNPAAVLFLSLKIVVLPVARMGNGQVAGWLLSRLLDGNPLKEAVACCTQILSC